MPNPDGQEREALEAELRDARVRLDDRENRLAAVDASDKRWARMVVEQERFKYDAIEEARELHDPGGA
jgi:hypothetical protein